MNVRIHIWGFGRVGKALFQGFRDAGLQVQSVLRSSWNYDDFESIEGVQFVGIDVFNPTVLPGDLVFVALPDKLIQSEIEKRQLAGVTFVHCSGATPLLELSLGNSAVFYPLQSFNGIDQYDWTGIPVFIEACDAEHLNILRWIAEKMGVKSIQSLTSNQRLSVHLSGVFANNFTYAMSAIAQDLLKNSNLDPQIIQPILLNTMEKILRNQDLWGSMTGPAVRKDFNTIELHLKLLESDSALRDLYLEITNYIVSKKSPKNS